MVPKSTKKEDPKNTTKAKIPGRIGGIQESPKVENPEGYKIRKPGSHKIRNPQKPQNPKKGRSWGGIGENAKNKGFKAD